MGPGYSFLKEIRVVLKVDFKYKNKVTVISFALAFTRPY